MRTPGPGRTGLAARRARPTAPIIGATRLPAQITDALAARQFTLTEDEDALFSSPTSPTPSWGTASAARLVPEAAVDEADHPVEALVRIRAPLETAGGL